MLTMPTLELLTVLSTSLAVCLLLIATQRWHGKHSLDHDLHGAQKIHNMPVPRVGGLAFATGLAGATLFDFFSEARSCTIATQLLLCATPVFAAGFVEDLTKRVSVRVRLCASFLSGALAVWVTGAYLTHLDTPALDAMVSYAPAGFLFTCFAVGGMTNAINIIDGLNGLAAGCVALMLAGLAAISWQVGDQLVTELCLWGIAALVGFLLMNFPFGKIFLGDGGAYLAGFWLAECGILLLYRNPSVSTWAVLLCCLYPVWETLFSIYRRHVVNRVSSGNPDMTHLHHLLFRQVNGRRPRLSTSWRHHGITTMLLWTAVAVCALYAAMSYRNTSSLALGVLVFVVLYQFSHKAMGSVDHESSKQSEGMAPHTTSGAP